MDLIRRFLKLEAAGGIMILLAGVLALLVNNSPLSSHYDAFVAFPLGLKIGDYTISAPFSFWINEALMAFFFMLIGIEIKKELTRGELATWSQAILPVGAALGGIIVPAIIYSAFNWGTTAERGWGIPSATDIAFSLAVLSLMGSRIHPWLKLFLMSVAVIDDLAAVGIIAFFFTPHLVYFPMAIAAACLAVLFVMNRLGVRRSRPYIITGLILWAATLSSGIHATIAGVALGFLLPLTPSTVDQPSLAARATHSLGSWVSFAILPLFAFANSGISFAGVILEHWTQSIPLGIGLGLFAGKQIGITFLSWLLIKCGLAKRPEGVSWLEFYGVCILAGIGFTMSLFIGSLAFGDTGLQFYTRLGVLMGSVTSAILGYAVLSVAIKRKAS